MLVELIVYISLLSMLNGILIPIVIDVHHHAHTIINQIKK